MSHVYIYIMYALLVNMKAVRLTTSSTMAFLGGSDITVKLVFPVLWNPETDWVEPISL